MLKCIPDNTLAHLGQDTFPQLPGNGAYLFDDASDDYLPDIGALESYQRAD